MKTGCARCERYCNVGKTEGGGQKELSRTLAELMNEYRTGPKMREDRDSIG